MAAMPPPALDALRDRLAELADLSDLSRLAAWDQRTMMPPAGGPGRAHQLATLERLAHDLAGAPEIGAWLDELEPRAGELSELDRDIVPLARRDWARTRRVPVELAAEVARAAAGGQDVWAAARARERGPPAGRAPALAGPRESGAWRDGLEPRAGALPELDRDIVRLARRDWERTRRVPVELAAEVARAAAEGQDVWQAARA